MLEIKENPGLRLPNRRRPRCSCPRPLPPRIPRRKGAPTNLAAIRGTRCGRATIRRDRTKRFVRSTCDFRIRPNINKFIKISSLERSRATHEKSTQFISSKFVRHSIDFVYHFFQKNPPHDKFIDFRNDKKLLKNRGITLRSWRWEKSTPRIFPPRVSIWAFVQSWKNSRNHRFFQKFHQILNFQNSANKNCWLPRIYQTFLQKLDEILIKKKKQTWIQM